MCKLQIPTAKVAKVFSFQNGGFKKLANASTRTGTGIALAAHRRAACLYCARRPCYKKIGPRSCVVATPQGGDQCAFYAQTRDGQNTRAIPPITLRRWAPWPRVTSHFLLSRLAPCSHKVSILSKR